MAFPDLTSDVPILQVATREAKQLAELGSASVAKGSSSVQTLPGFGRDLEVKLEEAVSDGVSRFLFLVVMVSNLQAMASNKVCKMV